MQCWICGGAGTTGEHRIKRSDLRSLFQTPTQTKPLYFHDGKVKNRPIGSLDAKILRSLCCICPKCNTTLTQPHDRAWQKMSNWLRATDYEIKPAAIVRANRIFPYDTAREMRNVHLYFVKQFGCQISEHVIPIDLDGFAKAILEGRPHPHLYLKFGRAPHIGHQVAAGGSDVKTATRIGDPTCEFASWFYFVGDLAVNIIFVVHDEDLRGLTGAWHPRFGTNRLEITDFR
jgi:hypothetical protein